MVRISIDLIRPLLAEKRVFLLGGNVSSVEQTGRNYVAGQLVNIQPGIRIEGYSTYWGQSAKNLVSMGSFSYTHSILPLHCRVGRYTSIASGLTVMGASHPVDWLSTSPVFYNKRLMMRTFESDMGVASTAQEYVSRTDPVVIGNDVWIGANVTMSHGITVGDGAVIATNATVTKNVEPYTVVAGLPARTVRDRFHPAVIDDLMKVKWWQYAPHELSELDVRDPQQLADRLTRRLANGQIAPYRPSEATYEDFQSCH